MLMQASYTARVSQILVLIGDTALIVSFFLPWLDLSTSFGGFAPERGYSPWDVLRQGGGGGLDLVVAGALLPFLGIVTATVALLISRSIRLRTIFIPICLALGILCLGITLLIIKELPIALALNFPYYRSKVDYGVWMGIGGLISICLGMLGLREHWAHSAALIVWLKQ